MSVDLGRLLDRAEAMLNACHVADSNPGLELGLALGSAWQEGRDKVVFPFENGLGLWLEQLLAESTGKEGKGLVPAPGERPDGPDRQAQSVELDDPYDLGSEFFRWEFATAVAGAILEINPFDQPNVQEAKDRTSDDSRRPGTSRARALDRSRGCLPRRATGRLRRDPGVRRPGARKRGSRRSSIASGARPSCVGHVRARPALPALDGAAAQGRARRSDVSSRSSTTSGEELAIPGQKFGFGRLIQAQAAGDYAALKERGRPVARVRLEEIA